MSKHLLSPAGKKAAAAVLSSKPASAAQATVSPATGLNSVALVPPKASTTNSSSLIVGGGAGSSQQNTTAVLVARNVGQLAAYTPRSNLATMFTSLITTASGADQKRQIEVHKTFTSEVVKASQKSVRVDNVICARADISAVTGEGRVPLTLLRPHEPFSGAKRPSQKDTIIYAPDVKMSYMNDADKSLIMLAGDVNHPMHTSVWGQFVFLMYALVEDRAAAVAASNDTALKAAPSRLLKSPHWRSIDPNWKLLIKLGNVNATFGPPATAGDIKCTSRPYKPNEGTAVVVKMALENELVMKRVCESIAWNGAIPKKYCQMATANCSDPEAVDPWELEPEIGAAAKACGFNRRDHPLGQAIHASFSIQPKYPNLTDKNGKPRPSYLFYDKTASGYGVVNLVRTINILPPSLYENGTETRAKTLPELKVIPWFTFAETSTYTVPYRIGNVDRFNSYLDDANRFNADIKLHEYGQSVCITVTPDYELTVMRYLDESVARLTASRNPETCTNKQMEDAEDEARDSFHIPAIVSYLPAPEVPEIIVREENARNKQVSKQAANKRRYKNANYVGADDSGGGADMDVVDDAAAAASTTSAGGAAAGQNSDAAAAAPGAGPAAPKENNVTTKLLMYDWLLKSVSLRGPLIFPTKRWVREAVDESTGKSTAIFVEGEIAEGDKLMNFIDFDQTAIVQMFRAQLDADHLEYFGLAQTDVSIPTRLVNALLQKTLLVFEGTTASKTEIEKTHRYFETMFTDKEEIEKNYLTITTRLMERISLISGLVDELLHVFKQKKILRVPVPDWEDDAPMPEDMQQLVSQFVAYSIHPGRSRDYGAVWVNKVLFDVASALPGMAIEVTPATAAHLETRVNKTGSRFGVGVRKLQRNVVLLNGNVPENGASGQADALAKTGNYRFFVLSMDLLPANLIYRYGKVTPDMWSHVFSDKYYNLDPEKMLMTYFNEDCKLKDVPAVLVNNRIQFGKEGPGSPFLLFAVTTEDADAVGKFVDKLELSRFIAGESSRVRPRRRNQDAVQIEGANLAAQSSSSMSDRIVVVEEPGVAAATASNASAAESAAADDDMDVDEDADAQTGLGAAPTIADANSTDDHAMEVDVPPDVASVPETPRKKPAKRAASEITPHPEVVDTDASATAQEAAKGAAASTEPTPAAAAAASAPPPAKKTKLVPAPVAGTKKASAAKPKVAPAAPAPSIDTGDEETVKFVPRKK